MRFQPDWGKLAKARRKGMLAYESNKLLSICVVEDAIFYELEQQRKDQGFVSIHKDDLKELAQYGNCADQPIVERAQALLEEAG